MLPLPECRNVSAIIDKLIEHADFTIHTLTGVNIGFARSFHTRENLFNGSEAKRLMRQMQGAQRARAPHLATL